MKKIVYLLSILIAFSFTSCNKNFLNAPSKSSLDASTIFSNYDLAKGAVDGIEVPFGQTNSYRGRFLPWYGMNTDAEWYNSSSTVGDKSNLCTYNATPTNDQMNTSNNAWAMMYKGIERANICIQGLQEYGNPKPGTQMGDLLGTALTLRAIYYADLVKAWGDVPARFKPITSATLYVPKSSRDVIYKQIIKDLGQAENLVPWPNASSETSTVEQINKAFVKGFRARLALAAAGYSQYPDGIHRSTDPSLSVDSMYTLAYKECMSVINSGTCHLNPSFEDVFKKNCEANIAAGGEVLWEIPFASGRGRMLSTFAIRHLSNDQWTEQPKGGEVGPIPSLFYDYNKNDTRRDVTCIPYEWGIAVNGIAQQEPLSLNTWDFGKYRYEWTSTPVVSTNDDGVNDIYMRYAEVIMMAAETANQLQGPSAAAPFLKMIRERAFPQQDWPTEVDAYVDSLTSQQSMFNAIVREYKLEFAGEMLRKQELIRWNLLKTKLDEAKTDMNDLRNHTGKYTNVPQTLYYRYASDGVTLQFYGLNRGDTANMSSEYPYEIKSWCDSTAITDTQINAIYARNPNNYEYWPIWQVFIDASKGTLKNDYGY